MVSKFYVKLRQLLDNAAFRSSTTFPLQSSDKNISNEKGSQW
jgi:hypothetical protein